MYCCATHFIFCFSFLRLTHNAFFFLRVFDHSTHTCSIVLSNRLCIVMCTRTWNERDTNTYSLTHTMASLLLASAQRSNRTLVSIVSQSKNHRIGPRARPSPALKFNCKKKKEKKIKTNKLLKKCTVARPYNWLHKAKQNTVAAMTKSHDRMQYMYIAIAIFETNRRA